MTDTSLFRSGLVWLAAGLGLTVYATVGILIHDIPGLEQLISWLESLSGWWILLAAFVAIFIEGLYFLGSFIPGSSVVVVLAVLSQTNGWGMFGATVATIFVGWVLSGLINIWFGKRYGTIENTDYEIKDRILTTWFPAFRANYEVAQAVSGGNPRSIFLSSVKVKFLASFFMGVVTIILAYTIDLNDLSNEEGFETLYYSASIMIVVGIWQLRKSLRNK